MDHDGQTVGTVGDDRLPPSSGPGLCGQGRAPFVHPNAGASLAVQILVDDSAFRHEIMFLFFFFFYCCSFFLCNFCTSFGFSVLSVLSVPLVFLIF